MLRPPQQYQASLSIYAADAAKTVSAVLGSHFEQLEMVDLPKLQNECSTTPPDFWLSSNSQSSSHSQDHSFEMNESAKNRLLQAPKLWERNANCDAAPFANPMTMFFPEFTREEARSSSDEKARSCRVGRASDDAVRANQFFYMPQAIVQEEGGENSLNKCKNVNIDSYIEKKRSSSSDDDTLSPHSNDCSDRDFEDCDFDFQNGFTCTPRQLHQVSFNNGTLPSFGFPVKGQEPVQLPPISTLSQFLDQACTTLRPRSDSEDSDELQDYQEKKNFEFFFRPQVIQNHVKMQFEEFFMPTSVGMVNNACSMEIDDVPTEEELIRALMT